MPALLYPGYSATLDRGDDRDEAGFAPPGTHVEWQAAVHMLDADDWGPDVWVIETFRTEPEAEAWAEERSTWRLPVGAYPRDRDVRMVAVLDPAPGA